MTDLYANNAIGCTDGACVFKDNSKIMHTNGGCNCKKLLMRTTEGKDALMLINHLRTLLNKESMHEDILQFQGKYRWLSNFSNCVIVYNNVLYRSVEHAYMSAKSNNITWKEFCQNTEEARLVKVASKKIKLIDNWDSIKVDIMYECLLQKYKQEPYKMLLLNTGDCYIQEGNNWKDTFWGVDLLTGKGKNMLGVLIMKIRDEIR